jgi:predicted enzyme related to lactoylglutathione lyase
MPRVVHFEIPVDNADRATAFYRDVFGWSITKWEGPQPYYLVTTGKDAPGIDGALYLRGETKTVVNTIDVPSIDEYVKKIEARGGKVVMPKSPIPGVGYFANLLDTEGNLFGILESDETVKG